MKLPKPEIKSESYQAKVPKHKFLAKYPEWQLSGEEPWAEVTKLRFPSDESKARVPKQTIPRESNQEKVSKQKCPWSGA